MSTINEWGKLKKIVVGIADYAKIPEIDISLRTVNYADKENVDDILVGDYPDIVKQEANEDLTTLTKFLEGEGVEVVKPEVIDCGYYHYCPRDIALVYGDRSLAVPTPIKARKDDYRALKTHLRHLSVADRKYRDYFYNKKCIQNKEVLALSENVPLFDAANVLKANGHLLYLVSNSGNKLGAKYLQDWIGSEAKVQTVENVYSYMHIDSTIAFLREGLMLLNPERIKDKSVLPAPFNTWDAIMCPEPVDIGHYPGYKNSSAWIGMNLLSVNPKLVVMEENQISLAKELKKYGIESQMLPMRHSRTLGGSFHCVTLDLDRDVD